jgi:hypothetical protein
MDAQQIIDVIKKRRDDFFDAQIMGTADDPKVWSEADAKRLIADEYDLLLEEIKTGPAHRRN